MVTEHQLITEAAGFLYRRGFETREEAVKVATEFVAFCRGRAWVFSDLGTPANREVLMGIDAPTFRGFDRLPTWLPLLTRPSNWPKDLLNMC